MIIFNYLVRNMKIYGMEQYGQKEKSKLKKIIKIYKMMSNLNRCIPRYNTKQNAKKEKKLKLAK